MDELKEKLKKLKAQHKALTDKAVKALAANDAETAREANDEAEGVKALIEETERALKALQEQEAERQAEAEQAEKEREAAIDRLAEEKARALVKSLGLDRPDYTNSADGPDVGMDDIGREIQRLSVMSRWDNYGTLDLATRYYVKSQMARRGMGTPPTQEMYGALAHRAHEFVRTIDEVPYIDRSGEIKTVRKPAFDIPALKLWDEPSEAYVPGYDKAVQVKDNVTAGGIKALARLARSAELKSDEVVYSTQSGYGDEWVPTLMAAALWRTIRLETRVLPALMQFDMPSNPYDHPRESTDPTIYGVAETTNENQLVIGSNMPIGDSKVATAKVTFSAGKIGAITFWSEEMGEDSVIPIEPQFRDQFGLAMAHGIDEVLLSGDETTTTQNISYWGTSLSSSSRFLQVDGLRHEPLVTTTADSRDGGALTIDDLNATRKLMGTAGVYGSDPSQLIIFCDPATGLTFEDLDEVLTLDKFGANATVLRGQLGSVKSIPLIKSQDYALTDSSGYINDTAGDNTKGSFLVVNRSGVRVGWRRRPRIIVGQVPFSDAWYILALARFDIRFWGAGMVAMTYDITI